ncbi:guanine nucleotide binding protein, alpha subunit [Obelidium mucronatum]|nr:guanine nucleotide binding protein, alpha subunit [Obelidium mucronatum]
MGNLCGSPADPQLAEQKKTSSMIDKEMAAEKIAMERTVKMLLLGPGESGKSTVLKQFRLIYGAGFSDQDRAAYRALIIVNILQCSKVLVSQMEILNIPFGFNPADYSNLTQLDLQELKKSKHSILASINKGATDSNLLLQMPNAAVLARHDSGMRMEDQKCTSPSISRSMSMGSRLQSNAALPVDPLASIAQKKYQEAEALGQQTGEVAEAGQLILEAQMGAGFLGEQDAQYLVSAMKMVWNDPGVQYCFKRANEFQLLDTCDYFMNDIDRFFAKDFSPTDQDILNSRLMTISVTETRFTVEDKEYRVFDVGGQRSERRKWAPYFDDVKAIIFVVAISGYDQVCFEDGETNRVTESLNLFSSICNHPMFKWTALILFLNKTDLFQLKLNRGILVSDFFKEYTDANTFDAASVFFKNKFLDLNKYPQKPVYPYFTHATDTTQTKTVLNAVNVIIMKMLLSSLNML